MASLNEETHPRTSIHSDLNIKGVFTMKKVICLFVSVMMIISMFAGCGSAPAAATTAPAASETAPESTAAENTAAVYKVAIVQQLDHASLDEIRVAIEAGLKANAAENGYEVEISVFNGQNDATVLNQIGAQVATEYDVIIPIATLAAICMVSAVEDAGAATPIVYAAISDPEAAGLTGFANVTGTSDALNTEFIMDMMFAVDPEIQTVGLLYSESEANSEAPIAAAKAYLDAKGIAYVAKTGNTAGEILDSAALLAESCDAVFTPTDNVVMASEAAVAEILNEAGIPHYTGADSFVGCGAFATCGVNYTELGTYTAKMASDILMGGAVPEYHVMDGGIITVNTETAAMIGADYSVFASMANTVVEVVTG